MSSASAKRLKQNVFMLRDFEKPEKTLSHSIIVGTFNPIKTFAYSAIFAVRGLRVFAVMNWLLVKVSRHEGRDILRASTVHIGKRRSIAATKENGQSSNELYPYGLRGLI